MDARTTQAWGAELAVQTQDVRQLVKTDSDPRVRLRAQALLLGGEGQAMAHVARRLHMAAHRLRVWRRRCLADGRAGLVECPRPRGGRPHALDAAARALLETAWSRAHKPTDCPLPTAHCPLPTAHSQLAHPRSALTAAA